MRRFALVLSALLLATTGCGDDAERGPVQPVRVAVGGFGGDEVFRCSIRAPARAVRCRVLDPEEDSGADVDLTRFVTEPGVSGAVAVAAGGAHACALTGDGRVRCWGSNRVGQLGDGNGGVESGGGSKRRGAPVKGLDKVSSIAAAEETSCAVRAGQIRCWGGDEGLLADAALDHESENAAYRLTPGAVKGVGDAVAVKGVRGSFCAVLVDGSVACWGVGYVGPDRVAGIAGARRFTKDPRTLCVERAGGRRSCITVRGQGYAAE